MRKVKILIFLLVILLAFFTIYKSTFAQQNQRIDRSKFQHQRVCVPGTKGEHSCHARVIVDMQGKPHTSSVPTGYGPLQFRTAYNLGSGNTATNQTIAVVDAYNDPYILNDLNVYSKQFSLPQMNSCPVSKGTPSAPCFQKVDQNGGTNYPKTNSGWALEISLDVEVAHAICQNCSILLVEAASASYTNLMAAVDRAVKMGATVVSNSYGSSEFSGETSYDFHFSKPGVAFTFSSGDGGYGADYPAASKYVTAVGGTTLNLNSDNTYKSESAWNGSGSGCSAYESKPSFQRDTGCKNRTIADVSADADPYTGAAVYDSVPYYGQSGWFQVGGTSLASPLVAGVYALVGGIPSAVQGNSLPYSNPSNLHDVITGSNGNCGGSYLCTAGPGYDGPTGLGTPNGMTAF